MVDILEFNRTFSTSGEGTIFFLLFVCSGSCLKRNLDKNMVSWRVIQRFFMISNGEPYWQSLFGLSLHNYIHCRLGGLLVTVCSAFDPTFWPIHALVDKLWNTFQLRGRLEMTGHGVWDNADNVLMGSRDALWSRDVIDEQHYPGNVCVLYNHSLPPNEALRQKYHFGLHLPRRSHLFATWDEIKHWKLTKAEETQLMTLSFFLRDMAKKVGKKPDRVYEQIHVADKLWQKHWRSWTRTMDKQRLFRLKATEQTPLQCLPVFPPKWQRCVI